MQLYKSVYRAGEFRETINKSIFIAHVSPVRDDREAREFIAGIKEEYKDATHNVPAFVTGNKQEHQWASDDGEPQGTSGPPVLNLLTENELTNLALVVTRYFGGTLLGTGGLVRAYSGAVKEGLKNSVIVEKRLAEKLTVQTDYTGLGKIQYILGEENITVLDSEYTDQVVLTLLVPVDAVEPLMAKLTEGTNGRCVIERAEKLYYGLLGKEIVFF